MRMLAHNQPTSIGVEEAGDMFVWGGEAREELFFVLLSRIEEIGWRNGLAPSTIEKKKWVLKLLFENDALTSPAKFKQMLQKKAFSPNTKNTIKAETKWIITHVLGEKEAVNGGVWGEVLKKEK